MSGAVSFTVIETVPYSDGRRPLLTKIRGPRASDVRQYDNPKDFLFSIVSIQDSEEHFELLQTLGPCPHHAIVRGVPVAGVDFSQSQRRLIHKQPDGAMPTLERDALVGWAAFDLDRSAAAPGIDWRTHPREAAEAIAQRDLPSWVTEADYVAYWSSSQGFADDMKLRVFVLLEKPITSADLKRLMKPLVATGTCPVDLALYSDAQLHYTATPLFIGNVSDPLPGGRHYLFKGQNRRAVLPPLPPADDPAQRLSTAITAPGHRNRASAPHRHGRGGRGGTSSPAIVAAIDSMGDGAGEHGFHRPWNSALAIFFAQNGPNADPLPLISKLRRRILECGTRDAAYVDRETLGMIKRARVLAALERGRCSPFPVARAGAASANAHKDKEEMNR